MVKEMTTLWLNRSAGYSFFK